MVKMIDAFNQIHSLRVLVVGDFVLDIYTQGKVQRISPEAPVPILKVASTHSLPGMAGNVAMNLQALGAEVSVLGRVGDDLHGQALRTILHQQEIQSDFLFTQKNYPTAVKNRMIGAGQQLMRIDQEEMQAPSKEFFLFIKNNLSAIFEQVDVMAISDYMKGFLTNEMLSFLITEGKKRGIPILVDPKGDDFSKYNGASLIKPNQKEAYLAAKCSPEVPLDQVVEILFQQVDVDQFAITRSEEGISLFRRQGKKEHFPVVSKEVKDVTGAGDTVLSMMTVGVGNGLDLAHTMVLANLAASLAIERLGCATISLSDLANRLLEKNISNKIYDEEHLFVLQHALKEVPFILVAIEQSSMISLQMIQQIRELHLAHPRVKLVVYIEEDPEEGEDAISLLSSLAEVDFIILQSRNLAQLTKHLEPISIYKAKEGTLQRVHEAKQMLQEILSEAVW